LFSEVVPFAPRALCIAVLGLLAAAVPAAAEPPSNDSPFTPAPFAPYAADSGAPRELQAIAELADATIDRGVPRCLGSGSFRRTVWYRVEPSLGPMEVTVEAMGSTLDVVDLAAFVQPEGATTPVLDEPSACGGEGAGGADISADATSGLSLRVPINHAVLIQVGRHGPLLTRDQERTVLALDTEPFFELSPFGDHAADAGRLPARRSRTVPLAGATLTEEDPAQPACQALGTVWRKFDPKRAGRRLISADGFALRTLTVFEGDRPEGGNAVDCVNRSRSGPLQMSVNARRRRTLWVRLGTDRPTPDAEAVVSAAPSPRRVVDGGPGGVDPTPGGPAGGLPAGCVRSSLELADVSGRIGLGSGVVTLALRVRDRPICDAELAVEGPRGHVYAHTYVRKLKGRRTLRIGAVRRLQRGRYRLQLVGESPSGRTIRVDTDVTGRRR
jgi:hypothetical protein